MATENSNTASNKPTHEFRAGKIKVSIWTKQKPGKHDTTIVEHSVKLTKSYYDETAKTWKDTEYLFPDELPKATLLLQKAYATIVLSETK